MAVWEDLGLQWNCGMVPLYERDFVCIDDRYYLNSQYASREKERLQNSNEAWKHGDQPRSLQILTFPAYCRYRALKERLLCGACLSKAQLVALGGILGDQRSTRVLFCRDSFHHPYLDKFELSGDNKAPVLKGRPRKKKRLNAPQNSVLKKKRFVADIQNHLGGSPAAKRCKISEEDESASSDMSEGVLERIKVPSQAPRAVQNTGPPTLVKPKVQILPKVTTQNVPLTSPPPLISSNSVKGGIQHNAHVNHEQADVKVVECSRTTPMENQIHSVDLKLKKLEKANNNNTVLLDKSLLVDNIQMRVTSAPLTSPSSSLVRTGKTLTASVENKRPPQPQSAKIVTNTVSVEHTRKVTAGQADARSVAATIRPVATTQGMVSTQMTVSTGPIVRTQPVASVPHPVTSTLAIAPKPQQCVTTMAGPASPTVKSSDGGNTGGPLAARSKPCKENEDKQSRLAACISEERKENEMDHHTEEAVVWKKKKKRLRMPGSVKDEVYDDEDEKYFMQTLGDFMRKNNQPLGKLPALGFKKVNLWTMYTTAQRFGGYDAVTSKRLWRRVYDSLGGSTTITSAATYTRRHYERLLLPYERHIRSQLKKQMDEKNPPAVNELAPKEPLNKPEKKQGLAISNNKQKSSTSPDKGKAPAMKRDVAATGANPVKAPLKIAALSTPQTMPVKVNVTSSAQGNALKTAPSSHPVQTAALSTVNKDVGKQDLPPAAARPVRQEHQESKPWSDRTKADVSQPSAMPREKRDKVIPSEHFKAPSSHQRANYRCVKVMSSDEETSARTNTIYTKKTTGINNIPKQSVLAASPQRVTRVVHDGAPKSASPQQFTTASKSREVIDLTSDDSPPRPQSKNPSVPHVKISPGNGNTQETSKVPQTMSSKDPGVRRHTSKSQFRREYGGGSMHHSIGEVQPSKEASPVYDSQTYSVHHQGKPNVPPHLPVSSPALAVKKNLDEIYLVQQETGLPKHDKKRHQQARAEGIEGRFTHSPSSDTAEEHFAEWLRRQSSLPPHTKPPVCHQRHIGNPDMGNLKYSYVTEEMCPPDCPCSLPTSRKDESVSVALPKPKKEHYEEDLPFAGVAWRPAMVDHPDLYISTHAPHLSPPPDSLASMYSASRIFIPPAQIFSPPYHLGMPPMSAPPLMAGTDDQLHIHPHCLMASPYPCSSSSRTPDGAAYPLYSFT